MTLPSSRHGLSTALRSLQYRLHSSRLSDAVTAANGTRCLSTESSSAGLEPIRAAPEIDYRAIRDMVPKIPPGGLDVRYARAMPISPSYFARTTRFNDTYLALEKLLKTYENLPTIPYSETERVVWKNLNDFRRNVGEPVKASEYVKCLEIVKRLHQIHPKLMPKKVKTALWDFTRSVQAFKAGETVAPIDKFGRTIGNGRRKASTARAFLVEGNGEVLINGKTLVEYFGRVHDRESAVWALHATGRLDKYNVWATAEGGGTTGQADALTLAIAKALMAHEPALKPALRRGNRLRDTRPKEGGEKEAWPREGEKETYMGQEIVLSRKSIKWPWASHEPPVLEVILPLVFPQCKPYFCNNQATNHKRSSPHIFARTIYTNCTLQHNFLENLFFNMQPS
ncbi:putative mitochondrial SSU ribosomal protein S9 precursor [Podospora fimiseda]|uniref:Mitochondrial SSU ribosomal protein S9 n=1 Tax=Podospora fimiseda TaxID=252190 RepID=A0AAN7GWS1_9PEZI|nr:putative mitochondrial SSU ribosomal protein S9 precursor [Podospora fimiseda]